LIIANFLSLVNYRVLVRLFKDASRPPKGVGLKLAEAEIR
jgi:hypothetical protein